MLQVLYLHYYKATTPIPKAKRAEKLKLQYTGIQCFYNLLVKQSCWQRRISKWKSGKNCGNVSHIFRLELSGTITLTGYKQQPLVRHARIPIFVTCPNKVNQIRKTKFT